MVWNALVLGTLLGMLPFVHHLFSLEINRQTEVERLLQAEEEAIDKLIEQFEE